MTVERMQAEMSNDEFLKWVAFFKWRDAVQEARAKEAE